MIGELAAPADPMNREARIEEVALPGAGPRGVEGRMFEEPDPLAGAARGDGVGQRLHAGQRLGVAGQARRDEPLDRRSGALRTERRAQRLARVSHRRSS